MANTMSLFGGAVWRITDNEAAGISEPLARLLARRLAAQQVVKQLSDPLVLIGACVAYARPRLVAQARATIAPPRPQPQPQAAPQAPTTASHVTTPPQPPANGSADAVQAARIMEEVLGSIQRGPQL